MDRSAIYFGKVISDLVFMLIVEAIVLPVYSFLYNVDLFNPGLFLVILLGSIGYISVGTLLASMAIQARHAGCALADSVVPSCSPGFDRRRQS